MAVGDHKITVVAEGKEIPAWSSYSISTDILKPADAFDMSVKFSREAWKLCETDAEISIFIDQTRILCGYIGKREKSPGPGGTMLQITGRDKTGRLVDDAAPLVTYGGLHIKELAERICEIGSAGSLFEKVTLLNTRNRSLTRSVKARKARVIREPVLDELAGVFRPLAGAFGVEIPTVGKRVARPSTIDPGIFGGRSAKKRVQVGQGRWAVLEEFLREARLLAWSTADGKELFIGLPNYDQEAQYLFFEAAEGSRNTEQTNCAIGVVEDVEELYALYVACGAARGSGVNYGPNVTKNFGSSRDNYDTSDGTGNRLKRPKTLLISDDGIRSQRDATERAERDQLQREAGFLNISVSAKGHGQLYSGETQTIFAIDTMAKVVDESTETIGDFLVTSCNYSGSVSGTRTRMNLVPHGTMLSL